MHTSVDFGLLKITEEEEENNMTIKGNDVAEKLARQFKNKKLRIQQFIK